jgi:hypothetical protein
VLDAVKAKVQNLQCRSKATKNAPYSAEAVTESVQALADGNHIVTKNATRIFRDGEGRTRREQLNPAGTDALTINISDPIAGTAYVLDPATHMAFRNGLIFTTASGGMAVGSLAPVGRGTMTVARAPEGGGGVVVAREAGQKEAAEGQAIAAAKVSGEFYARQASPAAGRSSRGRPASEDRGVHRQATRRSWPADDRRRPATGREPRRRFPPAQSATSSRSRSSRSVVFAGAAGPRPHEAFGSTN